MSDAPCCPHHGASGSDTTLTPRPGVLAGLSIATGAAIVVWAYAHSDATLLPMSVAWLLVLGAFMTWPSYLCGLVLTALRQRLNELESSEYRNGYAAGFVDALEARRDADTAGPQSSRQLHSVRQ